MMWHLIAGTMLVAVSAHANHASPEDNPVSTRARNTPPNIVFLYVDDVGMGDIGCFGNDTIRTPHIDKLVSRGAKLTQHLTGESTCTPSRAALLTGRYPIRSGMASPGDIPVLISTAGSAGLPPHEITLAQSLKQKGYATALIGKWHLGLDGTFRGDRIHAPNAFGFDYFFGTPLSIFRNLGSNGGDVVYTLYPYIRIYLFTGLLVGLATSYALRGLLGKRTAIVLAFFVIAFIGYLYLNVTTPHVMNGTFFRNEELVEQPINLDRLTTRLVREGVSFLKDRSRDQRPFFLFMSWVQAHTVLHATHPFKGKSAHGPYGDEIEEMDWSIGQMVQALDHLGFTDNTIVYFSSDNGGQLEEKDPVGNRAGGHNGGYRGGKLQGGQEGGIRVPSSITWPAVIAAGTQVDEATSQMDLFPTLASMTGAPLPRDRIIDGRDITALLTGKEHVSPHEILFHFCGRNIHSARYRPREGEDTFKIHWAWPIYLPGSETCNDFGCMCYQDHDWLDQPLLYNIAKDHRERQPLDIAIPQYATIVNKLTAAKSVMERETTDIPQEMHRWKTFARPWLQPCCNFPYCSCSDPENALNYTMPF